MKKVGRKGIQEQSVNDELPLDNSRDKLRGAQECPGARNSNHRIFSRKPFFLILSNFPEEYFSDLTEYCNYRSRKDKMVESRLDFLRGNTPHPPNPSLEVTQIYCIKEEIKPLVIELNLLVKKKSYVYKKLLIKFIL